MGSQPVSQRVDAAGLFAPSFDCFHSIDEITAQFRIASVTQRQGLALAAPSSILADVRRVVWILGFVFFGACLCAVRAEIECFIYLAT